MTHEKAGVEPSATAEEFFGKYGGAFRDSYIVLSDPSRNGAVFFRCYGKYEKDCEDIEYATQFADMAEEAADQSVCPVGFIGYDIPAEVFIGENGLLYCVYEFKEDVDVFTSPAGILAYYLKNNVPVGVEKKQA